MVLTTVPISSANPDCCAEFELILHCLREEDSDSACVAALCEEVKDWGFVLSEADRHGILPLFGRFASSLTNVPPDISERLSNEARQQSTRALMLTARLLELTALLEDAGVDAIPYKGPTLAVLAYGDPAVRPSIDLDILVRPEQVSRAKDVLVGAGFQPASYICEHQQNLLMNCVCEYEFTSPDRSYTVEIHWRVVSREFGFEFPDEAVWHRLQPVPIGRRALHTLSTEDLLLALAAHGTRHLWNRLLWIGDVAYVLKRCSVDWERLIGRARFFGARRTLFLALSLGHHLLRAPIPPFVANLIEREPLVRRLHHQVVTECIHDPYAADRMSRHRFFLSTRESLGAKYRYVRQVALTPQVGDFAGTEYVGGGAVSDSWLRIRSLLRHLQ